MNRKQGIIALDIKIIPLKSFHRKDWLKVLKMKLALMLQLFMKKVIKNKIDQNQKRVI
jgi:hypothetical protein